MVLEDSLLFQIRDKTTTVKLQLADGVLYSNLQVELFIFLENNVIFSIWPISRDISWNSLKKPGVCRLKMNCRW